MLKSIYEEMIEHLHKDKSYYTSYNFNDELTFIPFGSLDDDLDSEDDEDDENNEDEDNNEPIDEDIITEPLKHTLLLHEAHGGEQNCSYSVYDFEAVTMPYINTTSKGAEEYFDIEYIEEYPIAVSFRIDYENYYRLMKEKVILPTFQILDFSKANKPFVYLNGFIIMKFNEEDHVRFIMAFQREEVDYKK